MYQAVSPRRGSLWRRILCFAASLREGRAARETHAELTRLFERYGNAVFRAAYAYLHNRSDAEDVMQDTFLQYFSTKPTFESEQHEKAWLLRVAVNASKNRLGSAWFRRTEAIDESCPCPEDEDLSLVWDAVRELPAELPRADPSVLPRGLLDRRDRVHFADAPIDHPFPSDTRPRDAARQAEGGV